MKGAAAASRDSGAAASSRSPGAAAASRDDPGAAALDSTRLAAEIARYAADKKALDVVELDLRRIVGYTDYFVIATGNTERQTKAIHDGVLDGCKREYGRTPRRVEGLPGATWILLDYLDVVVHVFTPATRAFYRLEALWGEAPARAAE